MSLPPSSPSSQQWDVVVAGGGPAGCTAAISAARQGRRVLLIERTCSLGGMGTSALVPAWCPFSDQQRIIFGGIASEVFQLSKEGTPHVPAEQMDWVAIDAEHLKRVYDTLVTEAGVTVLFDTFIVGADVEDRTVKSLTIANKQGLSKIEASIFIDTSGDADVVAFAGGAFEKGEPVTGNMQPVTICFVLANVNEEAYRRMPDARKSIDGQPSLMDQMMAKYPLIPDTHFCNNIVGPGCVGFNAGHIYEIDNTDPAAVSRAIMAGRQLAAAYRDALKECQPEAFGNCHLVQTGALVGARETRRIIGDYTLTVEDYLSRGSFEDEICRNAYFIDIHLTREEAAKNKDWEVAINRFKRYGPGESHGIPYRCLIPVSFDNVLVAGRSISTDRIVQGSVRVMPVCLAMGEAAGTAAALALAENGTVREVDTDRLRDILRENGGYLPEYEPATSAA